MAHQKTLDLTGRLSATNPDGTPVTITYDPTTGLVTVTGAKEPKVLVKINLNDYMEGLRTVALGADVPPVTSLEQRVTNLENAVSTLSGQMSSLNSEITSIKSDIGSIKAEIQEKERDEEGSRESGDGAGRATGGAGGPPAPLIPPPFFCRIVTNCVTISGGHRT